MKKIILLFTELICVFIVVTSCSADDSKDTRTAIPDKFLIKLEIKSLSGSSSRTLVFVNGTSVKEWTNISLPYTNEYTYTTKGDEAVNTACKCITISAWAYLSKTDNIESFNMYVDGKLVDSTKIIAAAESNGTINPTKLTFVYEP
jgi:hypothetical protein